MSSIDLNCDMGEGTGNDEQLMPFISSASVACGFHAGDEETMKRTVELALKHNVAIGAHPGFNDKANFGRIPLRLSNAEVYDLMQKQIDSLNRVVLAFNATLHHVKPHGALYNMAAEDSLLAHTIAQAIKDANSDLILYGLSGSFLIAEAHAIGVKTASEVFADRTYQENGSLTPRSEANALIEDTESAITQVLQMVQSQNVRSVNGKLFPIVAETICIHGDGKHAVAFAKAIFEALKKHGIGIKTL